MGCSTDPVLLFLGVSGFLGVVFGGGGVLGLWVLFSLFSRVLKSSKGLKLSGHHSLFSVHMLLPQVLGAFINGFSFFVPERERQIHRLTLMFTIHNRNLGGEWFTSHSYQCYHIRRFTPIKRIVATEV